MADAHQQVTVHLAVAAAAINNLPHKGQQIAIRHKIYSSRQEFANICREEFFISQIMVIVQKRRRSFQLH